MSVKDVINVKPKNSSEKMGVADKWSILMPKNNIDDVSMTQVLTQAFRNMFEAYWEITYRMGAKSLPKEISLIYFAAD